MAQIFVNERDTSQKIKFGAGGNISELELVFDVVGSTDRTSIRNAVLAVAPLAQDGLPRREGSIDPVSIDEENGEGRWQATVSYGISGGTGGNPADADGVVSFDMTGGTQHITQSQNSTFYVADANNGVSVAQCLASLGAIGVTDDSVEGVDITVPALKFSIDKTYQAGTITREYINRLKGLAGKINVASITVFGMGPYEERSLLFLGASGKVKPGGEWAISYNFAVSDSRENFKVGDITVLKKAGWDYMWTRYGKDATHGVPKAIAVFVEQVYDATDFTQLFVS